MTFYINTPGVIASAAGLPNVTLSDAELAMAAIPSLTSWYEAELQYLRGADLASPLSAWEWMPKVGSYPLRPLQTQKPALVSGSHGFGALQFGYGVGLDSAFNNGKLGADPAALLTGASAGTWMVVTRSPVQGGEAGSAPVGGTLVSTYGPNGFNAPHIGVDAVNVGNTGNPIAFGGGSYTAAAVDVRNGAWNLLTMVLNATAGTLTLRRNGAQVAQATGITAPSSGIPGIRSLVVGAGYDLAGSAAFLAAVGQISAVATSSTALGSGDLAIAEGYLKARYGIA
ncbi:hypothetical protein EPK99_06365 [Neorhizobium lilium]|uniref:Concanavalin A-like lectin/glucanases superfamily protein n=1 Tax=Neorhizobium lilium TaxID=2503024 RepID=A0A3S4UPN5_9HYPH|nr:hypothetical protein [Neorhizobium lilium]RWX78253.1 hypothetical protein EPK99_06365 [Neorhizobium lilium]